MTPHISWAFAQRDLTAAQRLVLIALSERANGEKVCFPSFELIAADCELSRRAVAAAVHVLSTVRGLITLITDREERRTVFAKVGKKYNLNVNVYRINRPDEASHSAKSAPSHSAKSALNGGAKSAYSAKSARSDSAPGALRTVQNFPSHSANGAPKPLKEIITNPQRARTREEGKILNSLQGVGTPQPANDPVATDACGQQTTAETQPVADAEMAARLAALQAEIARGFKTNYPTTRNSSLTRNEHVDLLTKPPPWQAKPIPPEQVAAMRRIAQIQTVRVDA